MFQSRKFNLILSNSFFNFYFRYSFLDLIEANITVIIDFEINQLAKLKSNVDTELLQLYLFINLFVCAFHFFFFKLSFKKESSTQTHAPYVLYLFDFSDAL